MCHITEKKQTNVIRLFSGIGIDLTVRIQKEFYFFKGIKGRQKHHSQTITRDLKHFKFYNF